MNNAKKSKLAILTLAIVIELVAVFMIARAYFTDSSSTVGLGGLVIGLILLTIGIAKKTEVDEPESK